MKGILPLAGAVILSLCFYKSAKDMFAEDYGATSFHGVGGVFLLGIGSLLLGVLVMIACEISRPEFFRKGVGAAVIPPGDGAAAYPDAASYSATSSPSAPATDETAKEHQQ